MSPVAATFRRTVGRARNLYSTAVVTAAFLSAAAVRFALGMDAAEGSRIVLAEVWADAVAPLLPILAALYAMDLWSGERRTGRIDMLLSAPVRERDLVIGKFLGAWFMLAASVVLSLALQAASLALFAPAALDGVHFVDFLPAIAILALQGGLWCAVASAVGVASSNGAVSACVTVVLLSALPRVAWAALGRWGGELRISLGEMPFDAHVADFAAGTISTGVLATYVVFAAAALFIASKIVLSTRFPGRGGRGARFTCRLSMVLAVAFAVAFSVLAFRTDTPLYLNLAAGGADEPSAQMRHVLSESQGSVTVTCFMSRRHAAFRRTERFLRILKSRADATGGLKINLRFVDPRWDIGAAGRLVGRGAKENTVVFEKGSRFAELPVDAAFGEHLAASAIRRVAMPPQRRDVYWTVGHGEHSFSLYEPLGMSDIARELSREGYTNNPLDLSGDAAIPDACALIIVAGAKDDFSRAELGRIDGYLKSGGRLLVLAGRPGESGVAALLPSWGLRMETAPLIGAKTLSGTDVVVSDFPGHDMTAGFAGSRIVLENPLAFAPSAAVGSSSADGTAVGGHAGADRIVFSPVACVGRSAVVAAVERGGGAGRDVGIRPTRIVAIGDGLFAVNGQLAARANGNRDFFMNVVAYLSGSDPSGGDGRNPGVLSSNADREGKIDFLAASAGAAPLTVFLVMSLVALRRRRRR